MTEASQAGPVPTEPPHDAAAPDAAEPVVDSRSTDITAGPGGVMTDEVGVITGELTLRTELTADGTVRLLAQYLEAAEWYAVTGGQTTVLDPSDLSAVHEVAVGLLHRPDG